MLATCQTPECANAGIAIDVTDSMAAAGGPVPVFCGVCGQEITDLTDAAPYAAPGPQDA